MTIAESFSPIPLTAGHIVQWDHEKARGWIKPDGADADAPLVAADLGSFVGFQITPHINLPVAFRAVTHQGGARVAAIVLPVLDALAPTDAA